MQALATTTASAGETGECIGIEVLVLLLDADIGKAAALHAALAGHNRRELLDRLRETADRLGVMPPTPDEVASWRPARGVAAR